MSVQRGITNQATAQSRSLPSAYASTCSCFKLEPDGTSSEERDQRDVHAGAVTSSRTGRTNNSPLERGQVAWYCGLKTRLSRIRHLLDTRGRRNPRMILRAVAEVSIERRQSTAVERKGGSRWRNAAGSDSHLQVDILDARMYAAFVKPAKLEKCWRPHRPATALPVTQNVRRQRGRGHAETRRPTCSASPRARAAGPPAACPRRRPPRARLRRPPGSCPGAPSHQGRDR